jgi:hypothetical protein
MLTKYKKNLEQDFRFVSFVEFASCYLIFFIFKH